MLQGEKMAQKYLLAVDAPDPDNLALLRMSQTMFGEENILGVLLTGRPINFDASRDNKVPTTQWNYDHSRVALKASAARLKNFIRGYGSNIDVFDGGIAPRTLVPHHVHFKDYYMFMDNDPLRSVCVSELDPIEGLSAKIADQEFSVLVGGPMTGLATLLQRFPDVASQISSVHAMYGFLGLEGNNKLMSFGEEPRGAVQFNVACDPFAGKYVVDALDCPMYFVTTDCTKREEIGFQTPSELTKCLEDTPGNRMLGQLYNIWFANAIEPRKEIIYIHDVCAAMSASEHGTEIYGFTPMAVSRFPTLPQEKKDWGVMEFRPDESSNIHVSTELRSPELYRKLLNEQLR
jgi:hypothetical protein